MINVPIYLVIIGLGCLLVGCSTQGVETVNDAVKTQWYSYTDEISRIQARDSQKRLSQRMKDYRLGADDILEITVFEWEISNKSKTVTTRVSESGIIDLPALGSIKVEGKSVEQVKKNIENKLVQGGILQTPLVNVRLTEFRSKHIAVVGAVNKPGVYNLRRNVTTLLDMLGHAGGLSETAGYILYAIQDGKNATSNKYKLSAAEAANLPGSRKILVDLYELLELGNLELNLVLQDGDVVYVPNAKEFAVSGYVNKPGSFPLKKPTTLLEAIAIAGGLNEENASPEYTILKRRKINGEEEIIPIDLVAIAERKQPNRFLRPNDILIVRQTTTKYIYAQFKRLFHFTIGTNPTEIARGFQ